MGTVLDTFLKRMGYDVGLKEWEVVENWPRIVGEYIAEVTACEKAEKGRLYVKVNSAPWRQELSYKKDEIMESVVRETGCDTIRDIVFY